MSSSCECPICFQTFPASVLERHASQCNGQQDPTKKEIPIKVKQNGNDFFSSSKSKREVETSDSGEPSEKRKKKENAPLAERMRPQSLDDYLGQDDVVSKDGVWKRLIDENAVPSIILWGPPGCGKTTLANVIAQKTKSKGSNTKFVKMSACTAGVAEVKEVVKVAQNDLRMFKRKTLLFMDEVHRFNKLQQDTFLPHIEASLQSSIRVSMFLITVIIFWFSMAQLP